VEPLRIELATGPGEHALVLLVVWIGNLRHERGVAGTPADILRRARALAAGHARVSHTGLRLLDRLEDDVMLPAIAKVVFVDESILGALQEIRDFGTPLAHRWHAELWIRRRVVRPAMDELVKVTVGPIHRSL